MCCCQGIWYIGGCDIYAHPPGTPGGGKGALHDISESINPVDVKVAVAVGRFCERAIFVRVGRMTWSAILDCVVPAVAVLIPLILDEFVPSLHVVLSFDFSEDLTSFSPVPFVVFCCLEGLSLAGLSDFSLDAMLLLKFSFVTYTTDHVGRMTASDWSMQLFSRVRDPSYPSVTTWQQNSCL